MRTRLAVAALATGLTLAGCSGDRNGGDGGGTVIVGIGGDAQSLFPLLVLDETSDAVSDLLFDKLAAIDSTLSSIGDAGFTPRLARSWDWSRDSLAITFRLDPAARFHDGRPVTARDVQFSFRLAKDPALGSPVMPLLANIDSVTVVDSLSATFWYKRRTPTQFYDAAYQLPPIPEHVYGQVPVADLRTSEVTRSPVGTGRFRFSRWEPGVRLELLADTANFRGRPRLDRVIFMLNQAPPTAAQSIFAGEMDFFSAFPIDQVDRLDSSATARAVPYPQHGYGYLGMNRTERKGTRPHPVLGDVNVRRAISMSVDRQAMLTNIFKTTGRLGYGPFPTGVAMSDSTVPVPAYDTTAAAAAFDAAGWRRGADGFRSKNGRPLTVEIVVPNSSLIRIRYAELLQEQLRRAGVRAEIGRVQGSELLGRVRSGDYDMVILAQATDPSVSGIQQFWSSAGIRGGSNFLRYSNPMTDAALDSASTATDAAAVRRLVSRAFKQIIDDAPAVWLYSANTMAAVHRRIEVPSLPTDGWWGSLPEWSIPADRRIDRDRIGLRPAATP